MSSRVNPVSPQNESLRSDQTLQSKIVPPPPQPIPPDDLRLVRFDGKRSKPSVAIHFAPGHVLEPSNVLYHWKRFKQNLHRHKTDHAEDRCFCDLFFRRYESSRT